MYRILREAYEPGISVDRDLSRKTAKLVQELTKTGQIKAALDIYEINGDTLRRIEESSASDTEKIFNLLKSIEKVISENKGTEPYLISIGERAELIAKLYAERQKTTQQTLEEFKRIIDEINAARKEQQESNMPAEVFSIYWMLKKIGIDQPEDRANQMKGVLERFPHWKRSETHEREVKQGLYKLLVQSGIGPDEITDKAQKIMTVLMGGTR